ncbi:histone-lysine N-methyltransferase EHMT1 isoform X1 [Papilio machaon]|uniref:histone-lysine N-methyltransferase EHMT1 isoform X1 n=1 Tax=Papilio machaon TaxID=76193 RepID=UPI001E665F47|nr:histone-lysine N-methyltransferase EHMT1 isoform X1 [Papilio machaon]
MHSDHDDAVTPKKKHDKADISPDVSVRIENSDPGSDKKADKDAKPRIVLTFRSEKSGAKNSNMKIVSTEEKHEEVSPRRSNRNRSTKWESDEDNETLSSAKKSLNVSQSVSENDEASDSSLATPKRSTRRRSKEFSENVLANAIARKEKSYNETLPGPTQRLSRRIKPTAKILANEELRMGLESQNNARLGLQPEKTTEEGVRTRRSVHSKNYDAESTVVDKKAVKRHKPSEDIKQDKSEGGENSSSDSKVKHLCKLGLKAINSTPDEDQVQGSSNRDGDDEENEAEAIEEDEEIDDESEVISKLLEADEDSSDEDFLYPAGGNPTERPRRSTRLCSSYGNESDQSSMSMGDDENKVPPRRSSRLRYSCSDFYDRDAAGPEEGEEAAYPPEEYPVVASCNCEASSNMFAAPDELTEPVFCQAIDSVDGVRVGCSHSAARRGGELQPLVRAGPRTPYLLACRLHTAQLRKHMCCAACGLFCAQGIFYQCSKGHLFHLECGIPGCERGEGKTGGGGGVSAGAGCPHCGVHAVLWQPANKDCARVKIDMHCSGKQVYLPEQREQSIPAYIGFGGINPALIEQGPVIPEDLLPSPPVDLKRLCEETVSTEEDEPIDKVELLHDAIITGEAAEQLIPKIVSAKGEGLESALGVAARWGRVAAVYLLHFAGAKLDALDADNRTPLHIALNALLDKSKPTKSNNETVKNEEKPEAMEVDEKNGSKEDKEEDKDIKEVEQEEDDITESDVNKPSDEDLMKVIRYLIAAGCDVNLPGPDGMTALHMAAQHGGLAACRLLLEEGRALVDARDHGGWTPLVWAAENSHPDVVSLLLEWGADAAARDAEGNGVVHWCALHGDANSLRLLLHAAPHAHAHTNAHADTPLHVAARQGHYACVVMLLARGARTDVENSGGELPVEVCSGQCQTAISLNMQMALAVSDKPVRCRLLCNDISKGREPFPVPCINEVDDIAAPDDFTYVTRHVTPTPLHLDTALATLQGCRCEGSECVSGECACAALGVRAWYRAGRLPRTFPYHDPPMLFECNQTCACNARTCGNRVISRLQQLGSLGARVAVVRTSRCGWALRALQPLLSGAPAALYCGELLPHTAADARAHDHYMFALDLKQDLLDDGGGGGERGGEVAEQLCVDAAQFGSAARFINHSCRPNLAPVRVFTDVRDLRLPNVALFALRDIAAGEELTFDYGDKFWSVKSKFMKCECDAPDCRYPTKSTEE